MGCHRLLRHQGLEGDIPAWTPIPSSHCTWHSAYSVPDTFLTLGNVPLGSSSAILFPGGFWVLQTPISHGGLSPFQWDLSKTNRASWILVYEILRIWSQLRWLQYFGCLMQTADSLGKTLMLERFKTEGEEGNRGWDSWMASLMWWHELWQTLGVMDREAWHAAAHGVVKSQTQWLNNNDKVIFSALNKQKPTGNQHPIPHSTTSVSNHQDTRTSWKTSSFAPLYAKILQLYIPMIFSQ